MRSQTSPNPAAWGLPDFSFEHLCGGARNTVIRGTGDGADYVFKTTRRTQEQLTWLLRLDAPLRAAGIARALPEPTLTGTLAHDGWTMERHVPGRALTAAERTRLRQTLRRLQRSAVDVPQRPGFRSARDLLTETRGGDIDLDPMPEATLRKCRAAWARVPSTPVTLCHGDLNGTNIAVAPWGQFVLYDWDEARVDHPLFDMVAIGALDHRVPRRAALAYEIATCWHLEPERAMSLAQQL
ncbi:phosphotransferase family protein [Roseobacteraceae bacterium S113]